MCFCSVDIPLQFVTIILFLFTATVSFKYVDLLCWTFSSELLGQASLPLRIPLVPFPQPSPKSCMSLDLRAFLAVISHPSSTSFPHTCCKVVPDLWLTMAFPLWSSLVLHPLSLCSFLPGRRLGERLPGAAKAHGKYTSNRHCKACQNLAPGHRVVYSGRLYGYQPASWQWFFCVFAASQKVLVLPYFWFILNPLLHVLNFMGSAFPLWAKGMGGAQEADT